MKLSALAVRQRTSVLVFLVLIVVMGVTAYRELPRESAPELNIPNILITSHYEGASPSDIESLVTLPLERKLGNLNEIKTLESTSAEGLSTINVEFEADTDMDFALQKVRDKVDEAKPDLPDDMDPPIVKELAASDLFPVMFVMVSGDVGQARLKAIAEDLEEEIESVRGVLDVERTGDLEREIRIEFSEERLSGYGLTLPEVFQWLTRSNVNTPGGAIDVGEARYNLKIPGELRSPDEVFKLVVGVREGKPIYLSDIAAVRDTFKDRVSFSRVNGREAVALRVTKRQGENLLRIASDIKALVAARREVLPPSVELVITSDESEQIEQMVHDLENNMLSGLMLVLAVIFVGLGLRNAILVSMAIPLSLLIAFMTIAVLGMTLNMVVLFSMILALGMLVDNGIVLVENIYRHHVDEGKEIVRAAMDGAGEVAWPVIASTATTVAAFAPLVFWPGMMGQFMGYLPKTVIIALSSSLLVALVITPPLTAVILRGVKKPGRGGISSPGSIVRAYQFLLCTALEYRVLSLVFFAFLLVLSIWTYGKSGLGFEMFPDTEPSRILVDIRAPEGTNVDRTDRFARQAEQVIANYGNIRHVTTAVGQGSGNASGPNTARLMVDMVRREERRGPDPTDSEGGLVHFRNSNDTMEAIRRDLVKAIIGAEVTVDKQRDGPDVGAPINLEIEGGDYATLSEVARMYQEVMATVPGVVDLRDDYVRGLPEVEIVVDKERAALLGLDVQAVGLLIKTAINGMKVGNYREREDEYDITARLPEENRSSLQDVLNLRVPDSTGRAIPLSSVARIERKSGLSSIRHIDKKRVVTVSANLARGFNTQRVLGEIQEVAGEIRLPPGVTVRYTGENEEFEKTEQFMVRAFMIACLLIALVLVTQFNSVVQPMMILTCVIMSLIGVFFGLMATRTSFGVVMTGMGVISLAGIVVNNAIVLIDYINQLRREGYDCEAAIIQAGTTRLRPVLLTAITTVLGLTPMAIGLSFDFRTRHFILGSDSAQYWGPMAIAVIFGLTLATALTLLLVPNMYSLVYDRDRVRRGQATTVPPTRGVAGGRGDPAEAGSG
jgi:multidrug efflux pump